LRGAGGGQPGHWAAPSALPEFCTAAEPTSRADSNKRDLSLVFHGEPSHAGRRCSSRCECGGNSRAGPALPEGGCEARQAVGCWARSSALAGGRRLSPAPVARNSNCWRLRDGLRGFGGLSASCPVGGSCPGSRSWPGPATTPRPFRSVVGERLGSRHRHCWPTSPGWRAGAELRYANPADL
jgi:hypothetical protein